MYTQIGLGYNQKHKLSYEEVLMMKVVKYGLTFILVFFISISISLAADQTQKQDRKRDKKKDGSCGSYKISFDETYI